MLYHDLCPLLVCRFRPAGAGEHAARAAGQLVGPLHPGGGEGRHLPEDPGQRGAEPPASRHRYYGTAGDL